MRRQQQRQRADEGHGEQQLRGDQHHRHLHRADDEIGQHLAEHDLERAGRHGEQVFHRAALGLARQRDRGHHHHRHLQDDAEQAGHDVVLRDALGIVAAVHDDLELALARLGGRLPACPARAAAPVGATVPSVEMAPLATAGSVASASIRICGLSPRSTRRAKSAGMVTTKATSPLRHQRLGLGRALRRHGRSGSSRSFCSAETMARV